MSNTFTLDAIRDSIVKRFAPTVIDLGDGATVELKSILRLGEKERKAVIAAVQEINDVDESDEDDDEDDVAAWSELVIESCTKVFRLISASPKRLIAALDHEDPQIKASLYTAVLTTWIGESQLGEAASSPTS